MIATRFLCPLFGVLLVAFSASAQISFQKVYAGFEHNAPSQVIETPEGYLISGDGDSWISGRRHGLLLMIDHQGQVLWQKQYGEHLQAVTFYDVAATNNGFIVVGTMHSNSSDKKLYIVQTDNQGNELWSKMIDGPQTMWPNTVMSIPGGYIISGHNGLFMNQTYGFVIRLDEQGNTVWTKNYQAQDNSACYAKYAEGNTLYLAGHADAKATQMKIDLQTGEALSYQVLGTGTEFDYFYDLDATLDGHLIQSGQSSHPDGQWVRKCTKSGEQIWSKIYAYPDGVRGGHVAVCNDGGYLLTSTKFDNNSEMRPQLFKVNGDGDVQWGYNYGTEDQRFITAIQTSDGGFLAVGIIFLEHTQIFVVKTTPDGLVDGCCSLPQAITTSNYSPAATALNVVAENYLQPQPFVSMSYQAVLVAQDICTYTTPVRQIDVQLCEGKSIEINHQTYTTAGVVFDTLSGTAFCDTILQYNISLLPAVQETRIVEFCAGDTVFINGQAITQPGAVQAFLPAAVGCDTLVTYQVQYHDLTQGSNLTLTCPPSLSVDAAPGATQAVVSYDAPTAASDCVCPEMTTQLTQGPAGGSWFPAGGSWFPTGVTQVCFRATDLCGSEKTCCFTVTVNPTALPNDPCDVKTNGCLRFELLEILENNSGQQTYRIGLTNSCSSPLEYLAIGLPAGVSALTPANGSIFNAGAGGEYLVRSPNFSPFYSVRFKALDGDLANGNTDIFEYTLPANAANQLFIQVLGKLENNVSYAAHLNTFGCAIGSSRAAAERRQNPEMNGGDLRLYPNPAQQQLQIDLSNWNHQPEQLRILTPQGRSIWQNTLENVGKNWMIELPGTCTNGLYFLEIRATDGVVTVQKFVVVRR